MGQPTGKTNNYSLFNQIKPRSWAKLKNKIRNKTAKKGNKNKSKDR